MVVCRLLLMPYHPGWYDITPPGASFQGEFLYKPRIEGTHTERNRGYGHDGLDEILFRRPVARLFAALPQCREKISFEICPEGGCIIMRDMVSVTCS